MQENIEIKQSEKEINLLINEVFKVYNIEQHNDVLFFFGTPLTESKYIYKHLWFPLEKMGYNFSLDYEKGEHIVIVFPIVQKKEKVWINVVLVILTIFTTMFAGAMMYGVSPSEIFTNPFRLLEGLPFSAAIMFVLGSHEMGHYIMAKLHGMNTTLPYFIPFPSIIGTMGAIIKHKDPMPNRKVLFDIGVSGPIVGLMASIIVIIIGLLLPPIEAVVEAERPILQLGIPLLFMAISELMGANALFMHPISFAGWVGLLITFLNLMPVGQLDGGHMLRAMIGEKSKYVFKLVPIILFLLGGFVSFIMEKSGGIWFFWSVFLVLFAFAGHPEPLDDDTKLDKKRILIGIITFIFGLLCFTLVPFTIINV